MSEIAKCPICGGKPLDKWEVTSARVFQTGQMCCGVDCSTNERWNQYAAAMELAKAEVTYTNSDSPRWAVKGWNVARRQVLEVFK